MVCPKCGNDCGKFQFCPACGEPLEGQKKIQFPEPPIGKYRGSAGYIEIGEDSVTFCRRHFFKAHRQTVPYSEIYAVAYQPAKQFDAGFLHVRQWQDRHLPMPTQARDVVWDPTGVYFATHRNAQFDKVYAFLRQCADIACRANGDQQKDENVLCGRYPGFYGYMEFGPQSLTVWKDAKLLPKTERTIAYDQIAQVAFLEGKGSQKGGLSIRARSEHKDLDHALQYAAVDDASIDFPAAFNDKMRQIYLQLTAYADQNRARWAQEKCLCPEPPVGVYKNSKGHMEIGVEGVTFYRPICSKEITIPYDELYAVSYEPGKDFETGFLCVRSLQNRYLPMISQVSDVKWDFTAVSFDAEKNEEYRAVYTFLAHRAQIVRNKRKDKQEAEEQCVRIPGFYGYMEFGPQSLTVSKDAKLLPKTERTIAYDQIAQVAFLEGKGSQKGGLSIRARNEHKDLDHALQYAAVDDASIDFPAAFNDKMRQIYLQLTTHADRNKARWAQESGNDPEDSIYAELPAFPMCLKPPEAGSEEQELADKRRALRASRQVYCPHCLSTSFTVDYHRSFRRHSPLRTPLAALFRLMSELLFLINYAINGDKCVCLHCGGTWYSKRWGLQERHVELVSRYLGAYPHLNLAGVDGACLQLTRSQVSLQFPEKKGCIIPFRFLVHADLQKSDGESYGRLTLRRKANRTRPLPRSLDDARQDDCSIVYTEELQESFAQVYAVLMAIIAENKKAGLIK